MKSATQIFVSTFGALWALAGIEHGVGEVLQGSVAPSGLMFPSWPDAALFHSLNGEPAMTIIPNLFITGISTILSSLALLVWAVWFVQRKNGGLVMIFLSLTMLLVGGGIFPPILGILVGIVATRLPVPAPARVPRGDGLRRFLAKLWPWAYITCLIAWLAMFPGLAFLGYFAGVNDPTVIMALLLVALGISILTVFSGFAYDARMQTST